MKARDLKEMAWDEYGQEAYQAEMRLRELEREADPYWDTIVSAQIKEGGRYE